MCRLVTVLLSCAIFQDVLTVAQQPFFRRSAYLDRDRRFHMEWEVEGSEEIVFKMTVRTLGYVAIGFSKDGTMVDSDFVVGWVADGKVYLQDRYAEGNQMPELDKRQDYELISGHENATHTTIVFSRKWDTCDNQDFAFEYDNTIRVMHAYSFEDPIDDINLPFRGVFSRGSTSLMLLQPDIPREPTVEYWDMLSNEFAVTPDWDTFYMCKLFKVPNLRQKHHITTMELRLLDGNVGHVHHIVVYECAAPNPREYDRYLQDDGYNCLDTNSPSFVTDCDGVYAVWAKGGEDIRLPEHIGVPLDPNRFQYYMLQIHYDNVNRVTGSPGRAGFRMHHTPHLRKYDAGMFMIGTDVGPNVLVPPGVKDFMVASHANPDCTGSAIPPEGVRITGTVLHSHLLGRHIINRHFRDNIELKPIADNKHYDPEYQQNHLMAEEKLVLPQDQLTLECIYDTTNRTRTTIGGYSTREEMCLSFITYYPRVEGVYGSQSRWPKRTLIRYIGSKKLTNIAGQQPEFDQAFSDFMSDYDWNGTAIRRFERKTRFAEQDTLCILGNGDQDSVQSTVSYPEELKEYKEAPKCTRGRKEMKSKSFFENQFSFEQKPKQLTQRVRQNPVFGGGNKRPRH